jgi:multisubunit Na+/H+ antiporter MnhG subunit
MLVAARVLLVAGALLYLLVGLGVWLQPGFMEPVGVMAATPAGVTTLRTWGALFVAVGMAGIACSLRRDRVGAGLVLMVTVGACLVLARLSGLWLDGEHPRQLVELRREVAGLALSLLGLLAWGRERRRPDGLSPPAGPG